LLGSERKSWITAVIVQVRVLLSLQKIKLNIMETLSRVINENDIVKCLTADGWETGTIVKISNNIITVFMDYVQREMDFTIEQIR
jgi:hypothetical protein